ncbi:hypothetical protein [Microbulbifer litoralis]|uniref:hypothetical protein n=1 Tax=Microbulbifer litoralis TaxID=2933965 RepID=UPI002027E0A6|nr:hypothetical protein [Microbulbifer sp. GX H0434]
MPDIASLIPILSACALLALAIDCYATAKQAQGSGNPVSPEGRLSDFVFFTPFIALYYHDEFWLSLLFTLPLILVTVAAQAFLRQKSWLKGPSEVWVMIPGPYLLTTIGYFMFFREGILADPPPDPAIEISGKAGDSSWLDFWPYAVGLALFLLTIAARRTDSICLGHLFFIPAITILPFFTDHYWWTMLSGFVLFLVCVHRMFKVMNSDHISAASIMSGYFYMMAAFGSLVVYAIFY